VHSKTDYLSTGNSKAHQQQAQIQKSENEAGFSEDRSGMLNHQVLQSSEEPGATHSAA